MLHLLAQYAVDHELVAEPGFKPKQVRWAILFSGEGRFLQVTEQGDQDAKRNPGRTFPKCPDLSQPEMKRGGSGCRHFLVDTLEVVARFGENGDDPKVLAKNAYFIGLLRQAASALPELEAIAAALEDEEVREEIRRQCNERSAKPTDNVTFGVMDRTPPFLVDDPSWHGWWREFRRGFSRGEAKRKKKGTKGRRMRCLVSGEMVVPVPTHPKIEGLSDVGGKPMGDVLAAFKQESFCSYGLEQAENAAVSEEFASRYRAALNFLIRNHSRPLAGAKVVHWYSGREPLPEASDPIVMIEGDFSFLDGEGDRKGEELDAQERARKLLESIHSGERADLADYRYYVLVLSGNSGRVVVRAWSEGAFVDLVTNVDRWFKDISITGLGGHPVRTLGIGRLITALLPEMKPGQKREDWLKQVGAERTALFAAALNANLPISQSALARVVLLNGLDQIKDVLSEDSSDKRSRPAALARLYGRMALIKAYHTRKGDTNMSASLNKEHPNPAYHCGRLLYMLARLQKEALEVKAGVVERFYVAASTTPALVLGRLMANSQNHLNLLARDRGGLANWFERKIGEIMAAIDAHQGGIPKVLSLEEQSLFALGYYHQMAEPRNGNSANDNQEESK